MTDREHEDDLADAEDPFEASETDEADVGRTGAEAEEAATEVVEADEAIAVANNDVEDEAEPGRDVATGTVVGAATRAIASPSELAVHIDDRISAVFVLAVIAVFVGILIYGIVGGVGGVVTGTPTPTPSPSPTASASP
jgi:hypothetical protein